jgi:HEAT repeat protein
MQERKDLTQVIQELRQQDVSESTLYHLSNLHGPDLDLLSQAWPSFAIECRQEVVSHLTEIAEADFEVDFGEVFKICLHDADARVRAAAVEGLWEEDDVILIRPLVRLLRDDESALVREAVATSLSRFALQAELESLPSRLADLVWDALWKTIHNVQEDLNVRRRAIESLAYFDRPEVHQVIERAYQDEESLMRISAVFAMGRSGDEEWDDMAISELDGDEPAMRFEACRACGELHIAEAVPRLGQMVADPDPEVRLAAVWALGQIGGPEAQRVLEICQEMGNEALQDAAGAALDDLDFMYGELDLEMPDFDLDDEEEDLAFWEDEGSVN